MSLENYFGPFRENIYGIDQTFTTVSGEERKIVYADWTASGRMYRPIEERLQNDIFPYVANTHTETNTTGMGMTHAYHRAKEIIKRHVNANQNDVLIAACSGMTGVINKLQRILGLKIHERYKDRLQLDEQERPVVFVTHMEHHSNQTSWIETIADVVVIEPGETGLVDLENFKRILAQYKDRTYKIAAVTSCSNVTGIRTPYHDIARIIHQENGLCFVDFACSAPYIEINMHPDDPMEALDAIFFSPHKFLGGPGSTGVLIFNKQLYSNKVPDIPGGGTVSWTDPWGGREYFNDIEMREDGGTPPFLQTIKAALCIRVKEEMGVDKILEREEELMDILWPGLNEIPGLCILAGQHRNRLGVISFYIEDLHHYMAVKMLNDKFGIQTRGGCSCAGTYGHYLLEYDQVRSRQLSSLIMQGFVSLKPGWVRLSIHPTMTDAEAHYLVDSIRKLALNFRDWLSEYEMDEHTSAITCKLAETEAIVHQMDACFNDKLTGISEFS